MIASKICQLASLEAKGGAGMVGLAGDYLNLVLQDLKLNRNLKVNRVTQIVTVTAGTYGPFLLEQDYLRTYDMSYPLQGPNGPTQFLIPITMEQWDAEFKGTPTANYPYEFATDLSTQAQASAGAITGSVGSITITNPGAGYTTIPILIFFGASTTVAVANALMGFSFQVQPAGGAGYVVGDIVTGTTGTGTPARWLVRTVAAGAISGTDTIEDGAYSILPTSGAPVTGGTGAGATVVYGANSFHVTGVTITNGGAGYATAPLVSPFGGTPTVAATFTSALQNVEGSGQFYIYPQSNGTIQITHRYMRNQPDIGNPSTSSVEPWFAFSDYLVKQTAGRMMGVTGDDRQSQYLAEAEKMLFPYLIMEGDEQQTVKYVTLDPRHFKSNRGLRPTKVNPY